MKLAAPLIISVFLSSVWLTVSAAETSPGDKNTSANIPQASLYPLLAAEMALDRNQPEIALSNYIAAAKETQDPRIASRAAQIALTLSSLETALVPAVIWADNAPKDMEAQVTVAALYIRLNQIAKSIPYLRQSGNIDPQEAYQYYLILFKQLQKEEESGRVVQALEQMTQEKPASLSATTALAEIYLFQGKNPQAVEMCQAALAIKPDAIPAIEVCTEALSRTQNKTAAKQFISKKAAELANNVDLQQFYIQFLLDNNEQSLARDVLVKLMDQSALSSEALLNNARLCLQAQWFDLAEKLLKTASKDPKARDLAYYFLARSDELQQKESDAIKNFQQVSDGPFHVLSQIRASVLLADKKQYDEALKTLAAAQANDENDSKQIILASVEVLNKANRYKDALHKLDDYLQLNGDDIEILYARSLVAEKLNDLPRAENDLKTILTMSPNHIDALNALGFVLANKTNRYDEAQEYLTRALRLSPNNAQVLDSIGWLYYKTGNYTAALSSLKKAAELSPDAEVAAHLGEVMWQMKDFEGAKKVWSDALQQYPTHENVLSVMKRLMNNKQPNPVKQPIPIK